MNDIEFPDRRPQTAQEFIDCQLAREFMDCSFHSTEWMSDDEIKQSIIQDILTFTMEERKYPDGVMVLDFEQLTRFVNPVSKEKARKFLDNPDLKGLIEYGERGYRIRGEHNILQAAMDFSGVFWEGFKMPEDCIRLNHEGFDKQVEKHGGVNQLIDSLAMEVMATNEGSTSQQ